MLLTEENIVDSEFEFEEAIWRSIWYSIDNSNIWLPVRDSVRNSTRDSVYYSIYRRLKNATN